MKILVFSDMEGASGIHTYEQVIKEFGHPFDEGRRFLTQDIMAAIQGLEEAEATEFVVADSHRRGSPPNVMDEMLPEGTETIRGDDISRCDYSQFTAQVLVGFHSMAGTEKGFLSHTMSSLIGFAVQVNGRWVGEGELEVWKAGMSGVPTIMAAGDSAFAEEIRSFFPDIPAVAVKNSSGRTSVQCLEPANARQVIRDAARRSLETLSSHVIHAVNGPVRLAIAFRSGELAGWAEKIPNARRIHERAISYEARDWEEARAAYHTAYHLAQMGQTLADAARSELEGIEEVRRLKEGAIRRSIRDRWAAPFEPLPDIL